MIETYKEAFFHVFNVAIILSMAFWAVVAFWKLFKELMETKTFFMFIFNRAFNFRIKNISEVEFEKWHRDIKDRFEENQRSEK